MPVSGNRCGLMADQVKGGASMNDGDATGQDTPVQRLYRGLVMLPQPMPGLTDAERAGRGDRIAAAVTGLVRLPGETLGDVACKLAVVGDRLRSEDHTLTSPSAGDPGDRDRRGGRRGMNGDQRTSAQEVWPTAQRRRTIRFGDVESRVVGWSTGTGRRSTKSPGTRA